MREIFKDPTSGRYKWREKQSEKRASGSLSSGLLGGHVHLPNFMPSTLPVAAIIIIARWFYCDMVIAWLSVSMLALHALCGIADIMANHYRKKLLEQTAYELAMSS